jgi:hypothetical protein
MAKKLPGPGSTQRRVQLTGSAQRRIDPAEVAAALGAERAAGEAKGNPGPVVLYALRSEIMRRRQSKGGRPGIEGSPQRVKIPLGSQDWQKLEELAAAMTTPGFCPSPGQVASVLLSLAIRSVEQNGGPNPLAEALAHQGTDSGSE